MNEFLDSLRIVWRDQWDSNWNGSSEARPLVFKSSTGYLPAIEISQGGGEGPTYTDEPVATLLAAVDIARRKIAHWHLEDAA